MSGPSGAVHIRPRRQAGAIPLAIPGWSGTRLRTGTLRLRESHARAPGLADGYPDRHPRVAAQRKDPATTEALADDASAARIPISRPQPDAHDRPTPREARAGRQNRDSQRAAVARL